jgi:hypothetical protein
MADSIFFPSAADSIFFPGGGVAPAPAAELNSGHPAAAVELDSGAGGGRGDDSDAARVVEEEATRALLAW